MPSLTDRLLQMNRSKLRRRASWAIVLLVILAVGLSIWRHRFGVPEDFDDMREQFKYGSNGSDHPLARGLPYWIWKVLPEMFPPQEILPAAFRPASPDKSYEAFGLMTEPKMDRPIGFSKRRVFGLDFIGLNCAFCHVSTVRGKDGKPKVILGGTGNRVDIEQYFLFLFAATTDKRFTGDEVMKEIRKQNPDMGLLERIAYRILIPIVRHYAEGLKKNFDFIEPTNPKRLPRFGPGRVDTWAAYKRLFVEPPERDSIVGIVDFPPIWNQKAREGMRLHWDGNTDVLQERNVISALGAIGPHIEYLDFPRLTRITDWIVWLLPPRYEDWAYARIDWGRAARGAALFRDQCGTCHAPGGDRIGRVEPQEYLGTDDGRMKAFTPRLAQALNRLSTDEWKLRKFRTENGYANMLLDALWLRAPYLHNGSVPTLRDLLNPPDQRPTRFCRGDDRYDWENVGFVAPTPDNAGSCGGLFLYDTSVPGSNNAGHPYGTDLGKSDKDALIEYLKTL